jgi:hypothetical protein
MPCDRVMRRGQTISDRAEEIRRVVKTVDSFLTSGRVQVKIGNNGAIAFVGIPDDERNDVTDNCIYRRLMISGTGLAKAKIAAAEAMAGRSVNKQIIGQGAHAHADASGNLTWHDHKG